MISYWLITTLITAMFHEISLWIIDYREGNMSAIVESKKVDGGWKGVCWVLCRFSELTIETAESGKAAYSLGLFFMYFLCSFLIYIINGIIELKTCKCIFCHETVVLDRCKQKRRTLHVCRANWTSMTSLLVCIHSKSCYAYLLKTCHIAVKR